jgi:hypothetical protein
MANSFDEFDCGEESNGELVAALKSEIPDAGYETASVDVVIRMARW